MKTALRAFRAVDFNWTHDLQSVWSDPPFQVDELHEALIDRIIDDFFTHTKRMTDNPIGQAILGEAGAGKNSSYRHVEATCLAGQWLVRAPRHHRYHRLLGDGSARVSELAASVNAEWASSV